MKRWRYRVRCGLCNRRVMMLTRVRRAHPPLCWHIHTPYYGWPPRKMTEVIDARSTDIQR